MMKNQYKILSIMLAGGLLTACSSEEPAAGSGDRLTAVHITAGISAPASRAVGSDWEADDIGVTVTDAPNSNMAQIYRNVRYKTNATASSAEFFPDGEDNDGIFFQDATETVTFSAYGPYREWTVASGEDGFNIVDMDDSQMGREAQKSVDFIHASGATASDATPTVTFTGENAFRHVMSRLVVVIKTDDSCDFSANAVTDGSYILGGMKLQALFNPYTGEAKASDAPAVDDWYLNFLPSATTDNGGICYTAILPPQTLAKALSFSASVDGQMYRNDKSIRPALESGKSYQYTITVRKAGLTVSGCTITDWADSDLPDIEAGLVMPIGDKNASEAAVGDFYMKDGSLVDKDAVLTDKQSAACIGIVFTTDPSRIGEEAKAALATKGIAPHGLVMALTNAADKARWGDDDTDEPELPNNTLVSAMYNDVDGYSETQWILKNHLDRLSDIYTAFYYTSLYGKTDDTSKYAAPAVSTGWFMPSAGNWWDILRNLGNAESLDGFTESEEITVSISNVTSTIVNNLNTHISGIESAPKFVENSFFWTSTEVSGSAARFIGLYSDGDLLISNFLKDHTFNSVRCVLAF